MHFVGGKVGSEVALDALLGTTLARLLFLALQMESGTGFASLGDAAVLNDGRLRLGIIFAVAKRVSFEQIRSREGFSTDLTLVRLFLRMHAHMAREMIEAGVALGALAAAVQASTVGGAIRRCTAVRSAATIGGRRLSSTLRCSTLFVRARAFGSGLAGIVIGGSGRRRSSVHHRRRLRRVGGHDACWQRSAPVEPDVLAAEFGER